MLVKQVQQVRPVQREILDPLDPREKSAVLDPRDGLAIQVQRALADRLDTRVIRVLLVIWVVLERQARRDILDPRG